MNNFTYASLVQALQAYAQRSDPNFINQIPTFIMSGQRRIASSFNLLGNLSTIDIVCLQGSPVLSKPPSWLSTGSFVILVPEPGGTAYTQKKVLKKCLNTFMDKYSSDLTLSGVPKYYTDNQFFGWEIGPIPNLPYPGVVTYYAVPDLINEIEQTNWYTQNIPEVILYSCLLETAIYLKDDERIQSFTQYYKTAVEAVSNQDKQRLLDNADTPRN